MAIPFGEQTRANVSGEGKFEYRRWESKTQGKTPLPEKKIDVRETAETKSSAPISKIRLGWRPRRFADARFNRRGAADQGFSKPAMSARTALRIGSGSVCQTAQTRARSGSIDGGGAGGSCRGGLSF